MRNSRRVVILAFATAMVFAGCSGDSKSSLRPDQAGKLKPMTKPSISNAGPITGPVRYLALGDSTGAGVGAKNGGYVARLFRKIVQHQQESRLTNRCFSGATTSDVLNDQMDQIKELAPNLVTVGIGINDIGHGVSVETFGQNYDQILSRLREQTSAVIVVTNIPEISSAPRIPEVMRSQYQQEILRYNQKLEEIAALHGVIVFDVYAITREELPNHPEYFSADGFHPSDLGYELWAESMWPTIARVVGATAGAAIQD
ncbi:MAG TPA: SGNH/GDSL hydrolase family protein [Pyrinomonadaceae bacterium]|nr:SGNH/GDSL hydrolase family protein [Pyrinomonadaceae bacterium]